MTDQVEEIIMNTDFLDPQRRLPDFLDRILRKILRGDVACGRRRLARPMGQKRFIIDLTVGRQR